MIKKTVRKETFALLRTLPYAYTKRVEARPTDIARLSLINTSELIHYAF